MIFEKVASRDPGCSWFFLLLLLAGCTACYEGGYCPDLWGNCYLLLFVTE